MAFPNDNPIKVARELGYSIAGEIGERAMEKLELSYASRLLPKFSDDPLTRVRINVLLYWKAGYYKSTLLRTFHECHSLKTVNITSMTLEKIFGSLDLKGNRIILPAFTNDVHFVVISELTSMLGGRDMKVFADTMNQVLEGEKINRQTILLGCSDEVENLLVCLKKGVSYDSEVGELAYTPDVCVTAATRPLEGYHFNFLFRSGYLGRHYVVQKRISDNEAMEHLKKNYIINTGLKEQLKALNEKLLRVKIGVISRPEEALTNPIFDDLNKIAQDEIKGRQNLTLPDVLTPRVKDDVLRELVSHALLRTVYQKNFEDIEELEYEKEDVEYVTLNLGDFIDFSLDPLIAPDRFTTRRQRKRDIIKKLITELLQDDQEHHVDEISEQVKAKVKGQTISLATIYNSLNELIKERKIFRTEKGSYKQFRGGEETA
jgi:hypothetical protein